MLPEGRVEVAAHAEAVRAADGRQPAAQVAHVGLEGGHLARRQVAGVDVDQHDPGVVGQIARRRRQGGRGDALDGQPRRGQGSGQLRGLVERRFVVGRRGGS